MANLIIAQMLYLESEDPDKDIFFYLNTPGGHVSSGLAIFDTMNYIKPPVCTFCMGQAASMAALLLSAGTKGKRHSLPHARLMIHQPWGGVQGAAADISIQAQEILRLREKINELIARHTGKKLADVARDTDRDFYMSAEQAKAAQVDTGGGLQKIFRREGGPAAVAAQV